MCFAQVFQVTGIYVPGYKYICSKFITALIIHDRGSDMIGEEREKQLCVICLNYILFVPTLCSLVLVVNVMHFLKYITLVPLLDFISFMQLPCIVVSVGC